METGGVQIVDGLANVPALDGQSGRGTRRREVWPDADKRIFDRAAKMVGGHGDKILLRCGASLCPDRTIALVADASTERGAVLRCGCTDRVMARA